MARPISWTEVESPLGDLILAHSGHGLCSVRFALKDKARAFSTLADSLEKRFGPVETVKEEKPLRDAAAWLEAFFNNPSASPNYGQVLDPGGTGFQRKVWQTMSRIPAGNTMTYGGVAREIGRPGAARAVGAASRANPLAIVVPCHRVVGAGGRLVGYAGGREGLWIKEWLLGEEGWKAGETTNSGLFIKHPKPVGAPPLCPPMV